MILNKKYLRKKSKNTIKMKPINSNNFTLKLNSKEQIIKFKK